MEEAAEADPSQVYGASDADKVADDGVAAHQIQPFEPEAADNCGFEVKQEALTSHERRWALWLAVMSTFDIAISGTMIAVAVAHAVRDNGVSLYCLSIQAFSHMLSSILLAARYFGEYCLPQTQDAPGIGVENSLLRVKRRTTLVREQTMSVLCGIVMLISSVAMLFKAFRKLRYWDIWHEDHLLMDEDIRETTVFLTWYGVVVYGGQVLVRYIAGKKLRHAVIWNACVASTMSLLFLLILAIAATEEKEWSWKAEPIAAMALSACCLAEGIRIVYNHLDDVEERLDRDARA
jgi:hypothetical protein